MPRAVQFDAYGPVEVLHVVEVEAPTTNRDQVLVEVVASSINPGEIMIRQGAPDQSPARFPSGQGSDLAGRVVAVGADVTAWGEGDEVIGWTDERAAQADLVAVPADQVIPRPAGVPWEQAASLYVAGATAYGMVQAVQPGPGEVVAVAGAAGGVGSIAIQLLRHRGARVLGIAGAGNAAWLRGLGVEPVTYGDGLERQLRTAAPDGIDAVLDCYGSGYVTQAIEWGVTPDRVVTIIDLVAAQQYQAKVLFGSTVASPAVLAELAGMIEAGTLNIPIAATYPLDHVRAAYTRLAERHTRGKIVLIIGNR